MRDAKQMSTTPIFPSRIYMYLYVGTILGTYSKVLNFSESDDLALVLQSINYIEEKAKTKEFLHV